MATTPEVTVKVAVILPAAGRSSRFHDAHYKKPFAALANRPVFMYAAERFINRADVIQTLLVISPEDKEYVTQKFGGNIALLGIQLVIGGAERADSVTQALEKLKPEAELICVHDAVRPALADVWIDAVFAAAAQSGAAILATPINSTVKRVENGAIVETVPRAGLWEAQTPQVFKRDVLFKAYAARGGFAATDEAQLVERIGHKVTIVEGSPLNLKITSKEDLRVAEFALKALPKPKLDRAAHPFADDDKWR